MTDYYNYRKTFRELGISLLANEPKNGEVLIVGPASHDHHITRTFFHLYVEQGAVDAALSQIASRLDNEGNINADQEFLSYLGLKFIDGSKIPDKQT